MFLRAAAQDASGRAFYSASICADGVSHIGTLFRRSAGILFSDKPEKSMPPEAALDGNRRNDMAAGGSIAPSVKKIPLLSCYFASVTLEYPQK